MELEGLVEKVWDWWMEEGKNRERLGELIQRKSMQEFLRVTELDPDPRMVDEPRSNPYIFWKEEEVEGGWTRATLKLTVRNTRDNRRLQNALRSCGSAKG